MNRLFLIVLLSCLLCGIAIAQSNNYQKFFDFSNPSISYYFPVDENLSESNSIVDETLPVKYTLFDDGIETPSRFHDALKVSWAFFYSVSYRIICSEKI